MLNSCLIYVRSTSHLKLFVRSLVWTQCCHSKHCSCGTNSFRTSNLHSFSFAIIVCPFCSQISESEVAFCFFFFFFFIVYFFIVSANGIIIILEKRNRIKRGELKEPNRKTNTAITGSQTADRGTEVPTDRPTDRRQ